MTTNEYVQTIIETRKNAPLLKTESEAVMYEAAQLISGNFTYPLYEALWQEFFDMDAVTQHLESLYDNGNHFGLVYFIFILANAVNLSVPAEFTEISANDALVPILSAAIIEDWLEYDNECEPTEYEN